MLLLDLPQELLDLIVAELKDLDCNLFNNGLLPLSSTCKLLRTLLSPEFFYCLPFTNEPASAETALDIAKRYGKVFRRLHFTGVSKTLDEVISGRNSSHTISWGLREDEVLHPAARILLSGIRTPGATRVDLSWAFDFTNENSEFATELGPRGLVQSSYYSCEAADFFHDEETHEEIQKQEFEFPWRLLMKLVWQTLTKNTVVKILEFQLLPKLSEVFLTESWRSFLGRLKSLGVRFPKDCSPLGSSVWDTDGFQQFMESFADQMLAPAVNIEMLTITGSDDGTIVYQPAFRFENMHFPALKVVTLSYFVLNESLVRFLSSQPNIEIVHMHDCWACRVELGENKLLQWAQFFRALDRQESKLRGLVIEPVDDGCFGRWEDALQTLWDECDRIEGSGKRLFAYARVDLGEAGFADPSAAMMLASLREGEDQRAYDYLMTKLDSKKGAQTASTARHNHAEL